MIKLIRWILLPVSFIYQCVVWIRNLAYDRGIFKSKQFKIPTIVIGNLAVGGTGKSPLTEHLINLLSKEYKIATLSRGYGRQTKGFKYVNKDCKAIEVGDEPLQFKHKFPNVTVAVAEDRVLGIERLQTQHDLILLDDAYQHRKLAAGFSILLLEFNSLFRPILTLPTGDFRDNFSAIKRANLIIISKCPNVVTPTQKQHIEHKIRKYTPAPIFYSYITYQSPKDSRGTSLENTFENMDIVLFCGIAKPEPLIRFLKDKNNTIHPLLFGDHHNFSSKDYEKIIGTYENLSSDKKVIVTTEKDMQRLDLSLFKNYPLYYIPIKLSSEDAQNQTFDHFIQNYISDRLHKSK